MSDQRLVGVYSVSMMPSITVNTYAKQPSLTKEPCDKIAEPSQPFCSGGYDWHLHSADSGAAILEIENKRVMSKMHANWLPTTSTNHYIPRVFIESILNPLYTTFFIDYIPHILVETVYILQSNLIDLLVFRKVQNRVGHSLLCQTPNSSTVHRLLTPTKIKQINFKC